MRFALEVHPTEIAFDIYSAKRALEAVGNRETFGFNFDPSHLEVQAEDPRRVVDELADLVAHMHLKDACGTLDDWAFVPLGQGEIDLEGTVRAMIAEGFDRTISVEHESHYFAGDVRPPEQVLAESKAFLDKVIAISSA